MRRGICLQATGSEKTSRAQQKRTLDASLQFRLAAKVSLEENEDSVCSIEHRLDGEVK